MGDQVRLVDFAVTFGIWDSCTWRMANSST